MTMAENSSEFAKDLQMAEAEASRARYQVDLARQQLDRAQQTQRFWEGLSSYIQNEYPAQALLLLRQEADLIRRLPPSDAQVVERLRLLYGELEQKARIVATGFGRSFPTAAREAGIQIDGTSRHPRYTFNQGFLRLDLDERDFTAKLTPRDGESIHIGLDMSLIVDKIRSEQRRLFERELEPEIFLRSLYTAYSAVLRSEQRQETDEVPLRRVTNRLAKNLNRFAADEFNIDLSRLVQQGSLVVDGRRLQLNHTRNQRQGMLLHGLESGGYVGFISFKSEKQS
jgi:hypothetical protein